MAHNAPQHNGDHNLPFHNAGVHNGGASSSAVEDPESTSEIEVLWDTGEVILWDDGDWMAWEDAVSIPDDFTISVPGGSYAADSLDATNATNGAGGISAGKMAATSAAAWTVLSVNSSRDQEISTSGSRFRLYLRYDGDKALFCYVDKTGVNGSTGILTIGVCTGLGTSAELATTYYNQFSTTTANADITGFTAGTTYLFGCSGLDLYVKIDGTERIRIQDFHHVQSGKAGVKPGTAYYVGAVAVNFNDVAALYSTPSSYIFDVRDLTGWKNTTTTGSISASGTALTVASASGLAVGDYAIVEIGAESGAGARGTKGVGGTWPALSYADAATRAADTSQANNTYAWQIDTGVVYRWATGAPGSWSAVASTSYYTTQAVPRSLVARITAISGTTVTLDTAATVTATNANVYVDMNPVLNFFFQATSLNGEYIQNIAPSAMTINIPTGTYYMAAGLLINQVSTKSVNIQGGGKTTCILKSPKGVHSASIINKSVSGQINDLHLYGNCRFTGFGLSWKQSRASIGYTLLNGSPVLSTLTQTLVSDCTETTTGYPYGAVLYQTSNGIIDNVKATDPWQQGCGISYGTSCTISNCDIVVQDGLAQYIQWMVQVADSTDETVTDCTLTSAILTGGFESFRSTGGTWARITSTNGVFSFNSADDIDLDSFNLTIEANSRVAAGGQFSVAATGVPAVGCNVNIGTPVTVGTRITNLTINQQGVIDTSNNLLGLVNVGASNPNVSIDGANLTSVDFVSGGTTNFAHIASQGTNTDVTNTQTSGKSVYNINGSGNRNVHLTGGSGSSVDAYTQAHVGDYYVNP